MPSGFPGLDPFVEGQAWETFHAGLIVALMATLSREVRPRYVVRVEERVYVEHDPDRHVRPDLTILDRREVAQRVTSGQALKAPVLLTLPVPHQERQRFLTVRRRDDLEVVTIVEVLSPANKRRGSDGRKAYLEKRDMVLQSSTHLVELDLLRGGERLPTVEPLPAADYYAFVCRGDDRPRAEVYSWNMRQPLSPIPIPLSGNDPDVWLDLQGVVNRACEDASFEDSLDHEAPLDPPVAEADGAWIAQALRGSP